MRSLPRRDLLRAAGLTAVASVVGACTAGSGSAGSPSPSGSRELEAGVDALPRLRRWTPSDRDVEPAAKVAAVRLVELAATWTAAEGSPAHVINRLVGAGYARSVARALNDVSDGAAASVAEIVVAQYGGLLATSASVLVAFDQWLLVEPGRVRDRGTTFDIRLALGSDGWQVVAARPASRVDTGRLTESGRRVLTSQRIRLPDAAAADIRAGRVDDDVLRGLLTLAQAFRMDVSVLRSGHPIRVFGTDRISDHTVGRAVDVWALDGRPVIEWGAGRVTPGFMRAALEAGAYQVGGPVDLDGGAASTFSDDTHQDHIHLGF